MAPNKRGRQVRDDEGNASGEAVRSATGHNGHKKQRLSGVNGTSSSRVDDDSSTSEGEAEADVNHVQDAHDTNMPSLTQYEIDRDGDFSHLAEEEHDDMRATQKLLKRTDRLGENHAAENGIIISVTMVNFMCHERLHVELGPLINFIIGENGSGKSAILTAITLCLGGKASTTNRGGSLKSFIKEGREHASLIIKLKNEGEDAYQPEAYGKFIIVERNFSKAGTSGFKLKSSTGRVISTKKAEVDDLIEYFQMQIDNPMNVLTQDAARQFLNQATPAMKYKFFVKGVQLEQLDNDYRLVQQMVDGMESKLEDSSQNLQHLQNVMEKAKDKAKVVSQHENTRRAIRQYSNQMAWAQVEETEQDLATREKVVADAQMVIEDVERDVQAKDELYQEVHIKNEQLEERIKELSDELTPFTDEEKEAKSAFDAATQELHNTHLEQRQVKEHLTAAKRKVAGFQADITTEQKRMENINGGGHALKLDELATAQDSVVEAKAKLEQSEARVGGLEDAKSNAVKEAEEAAGPIQAKGQEMNACEERIRVLNKDAGQAMAGFDVKISTLLKSIRNDSGFRQKPVGPVGLHIKLLKPVWSGVLEKSIGNLLNGFIVTSKPDQQRLSNMIRRHNIENCPVVIGNNQSIDTRGHEPDEQYDTILRILDIDNELVKRQLVINQGIEQTILIEKKEDADRIMFEGPRPRNVKQCFCLHPTRRGWGFRLGYMQGSSDASISPISPPNGRPRMKTDLESQVSYQKEHLEHLRQEHHTLQARKRTLHQAVERCQQAITQHKRTIGELRIKLQRAEDKVEQIQENLDKDNVEDGRLEALKDYLREAQEEVTVHEATYGESVLAKERQNAISSTLKKALGEVKLRKQDHEILIKKVADKQRKTAQARQINLQAKNAAIEKLEEVSLAKLAAEHKRDRQLVRVEEFRTEASKVCARVPVPPGETATSIDAKLVRHHQTLKEYNKKLGGTDEEILAASEAAIRAYDAAVQQRESSLSLVRLLKQSYIQRLIMWRKFQRSISARARINFIYLLSDRGFRGRLKIDHKAKLLDLNVEPDETVKSAKGRQTKTLSGGEKSFSSICLLLALWEAMGAPLRCLDEFDVFMDSVNRDVSTNMIITAARRSVGRQYILITPNAIGGGAERDKDVKLIRLSDPRQKQLTDMGL